MHIILFILKIVGLILLILLCVLLVTFLLCLFVPIKYQANAEKIERLKLKAIGKWMFPILYMKVNYLEDSLEYRILLFGIPIFPREKKEKVMITRKKKGKRKEKKKQEENEPELVTMEVNEPGEFEHIKEDIKDGIDDEAEEIKEDISENIKEEADDLEKKTDKGTKKDRNFLGKIKEKVLWIFNILRVLNEKKRLLIEFFREEENKKGIHSLWNSLQHVLKHIKPKRLKGDLEFGMDDPCQTGQVLGIAGVLFSIYGQGISIRPNFEEPCLKGEVFIKGRIQVFTLLRICIKLLLDDNFKQLKINYEKMKEAL